MRTALLLSVLVATPALAQDAAPALAQDAGPAPSAQVAVQGHTLFLIHAPNGAASAQERASAAQVILEQVLGDPAEPGSVTVNPLPEDDETLALRVDGREILRLGPADVRQSGLPAGVYAQSIAATIESTLVRERHRTARQRVLQALAMTVFLGLLAFLALRWISQTGERARAVIEEQLTRLHGLHLRGVEIVSPETLEGASYALVGLGRAGLLLAIAYAYLAYALSQFAATRGAVGPLTRAVTSPFAALLARVGELLPMAVLLLAGLFLLRGALRLTGFLLDRVARGEFQWRWLPKDLAPAARPLLQGSLVVAALLLFGPLVGTGANAVLTRLGLLVLGAVALGAVPLVAASVLGATALFLRRYQVGEWVDIGGQVGEVIAIGFFDLTLVPVEAGRVRVSHLLGLWTAVRHLPGPPSFEVAVPAQALADPRAVSEVLLAAFPGPKPPVVVLHSLSTEAAVYRLLFPPGTAVSAALATAASALSKAGFAIGGGPPR